MIRAVQITDAPAIQKLNADQLNYDYPLINTTQNLARLLSQPERHILLAATSANDQQVLGYVHAEVYLETYGPALFNILALAVSTTVQHRGVGCSLMTALAQQARRPRRWYSVSERQGAHQANWGFKKTHPTRAVQPPTTPRNSPTNLATSTTPVTPRDCPSRINPGHPPPVLSMEPVNSINKTSLNSMPRGLHIVQRVFSQNISPGIRLNSGIERQGAHQFYQQIGYTATKLQKRFFLDLESDQSPTE
ncbi:GNAT family N-acetyltransferase [Lactiplantibacillus plantarum]|uniref:GNAT family N-acetyltransferase n=1 Tax=Lactiplantibacillus plantarum TaxID=1590 RepID=UPI001F2AF7B5|nr:GNAT family N-acetyltransferase [Lactiplantibacillus plantarum]UJM25797.1 hypothetical protein L1599_07215 [Lactiplantibacillus plantarum]